MKAFAEPTSAFFTNQRVYIASLYADGDIPGKWVFDGMATGLHTSHDMCFVRQLEPFEYPCERGLVTVDRVRSDTWAAHERPGRKNKKRKHV